MPGMSHDSHGTCWRLKRHKGGCFSRSGGPFHVRVCCEHKSTFFGREKFKKLHVQQIVGSACFKVLVIHLRFQNRWALIHPKVKIDKWNTKMAIYNRDLLFHGILLRFHFWTSGVYTIDMFQLCSGAI